MTEPREPAPRGGLGVLAGFLFALWIAISITWVRRQGAMQMLWFCDVALLMTALGLFLRSARLVTAQLVALLLFHAIWSLELWLCLLGGYLPLGATAYMFYPGFSLWEKTLSFFSHTFVVPAALYGAFVLGAPRRAWLFQWAQTCAIFGLTFLLTNPAENINWLFGMELLRPATREQSILYYSAMVVLPPFLAYLPTNRLITSLAQRHAPSEAWRISPLQLLAALLAAVAISFGVSLWIDREFGCDSRSVATVTPEPSPIEKLPTSRISTTVDHIGFGPGSARRAVLRTLPSTELPRQPSGPEGRWRVHMKPLLHVVPAGLLPAVPQEVVLAGRRSVPGSIVYGVVASDDVYLQPLSDLHRHRRRFEVPLQIGGRGLSEFVDPQTGELYEPTDQNEILGNGTGGVYAVGALEVVDRKVVARSPFFLVKRQGIRFPEDLWFTLRGSRRRPLLARAGKPRGFRIAFQSSPFPDKVPPDVYIADFFGYDVRNVSNTPRAFDGFVGPDGSSCGATGWSDPETLRYCTDLRGTLAIAEARVID